MPPRATLMRHAAAAAFIITPRHAYRCLSPLMLFATIDVLMPDADALLMPLPPAADAVADAAYFLDAAAACFAA